MGMWREVEELIDGKIDVKRTELKWRWMEGKEGK